jgi:hypothetical protein
MGDSVCGYGISVPGDGVIGSWIWGKGGWIWEILRFPPLVAIYGIGERSPAMGCAGSKVSACSEKLTASGLPLGSALWDRVNGHRIWESAATT